MRYDGAMDGLIYNTEQQEFISGKHQRFAEILHDYNPYLSLSWIPPKARAAEDVKPFAIIDSSPWHEPHVVRYLTETELDRPDQILAWIFEGDLSKHSKASVLRRMELQELSAQLMDNKRQQEELDDRMEKGAFLISGGREGKHFIREGGKTFTR